MPKDLFPKRGLTELLGASAFGDLWATPRCPHHTCAGIPIPFGFSCIIVPRSSPAPVPFQAPHCHHQPSAQAWIQQALNTCTPNGGRNVYQGCPHGNGQEEQEAVTVQAKAFPGDWRSEDILWLCKARSYL